jgi:hydroxymethylpyrimidine kinase/phosphomethylpyrimidine kinase
MSNLVASIGTTHPWNIAGVGLDARVCAEYGVDHAMAVVAVSAQDEHGLHELHVVPAEAVGAQLQSLPDEVAAYRIGALVSSKTVHVVARFLRERSDRVPVVVDPVMTVSLGGALQSDPELPATLREELLTLPVILTPNVPETERLLETRVARVEDLRAAAKAFVERGARAAYVKGGHLLGDPIDVLVSGSTEQTFSGARLDGSMRGSGCTLAASLAAELALGHDLPGAAAAARAYVRTKIAARTMRGGLQVAF